MKKHLLAFLPLVFLLNLTSCDSPGTHNHEFSSNWSSDENYHWHDATCGHEVKDSYGEHEVDENGFCSVCGKNP